MNSPQYLFVIFFMATVAVANHIGPVIKNYQGQDTLDKKGNYQLQWFIDWGQRRVNFNVSCVTSGWVGLGFSKDGSMKDADMVVVGVGPDGRPYLTDLYSDCHRNYNTDNNQDWTLLGYSTPNGATVVHLSRLLDTCDPQDFPITDDLLHIIWAYGESDVLGYHYQNRGTYKVYLLDPVIHPASHIDLLPRWRITKTVEIPPKRTTYWCTIHKIPPTVTAKNHFVQFSVVAESEVALNHTHHHLLYRCAFQPGQDPTVLDQFVYPTYPGEECYFSSNPRIPISNCRQIVYFWSLGGNSFVLPDDVGIPFGTTAPNEYYVLETHFDNPEIITGLSFEVGIEAVYTNELRPYDGSSFLVLYYLPALFYVPPGSQNFQVYSLCGPDCTNIMFPSTGVDVYAVHLHSHCTAKNMKLQQFRNGVELPWIMKDDNYDVRFQQQRPLYTSRKILPGDQLVMNCIYDNADIGLTSFQGFSASNKMCVGAVYIKQPTSYYACASFISDDVLLPFLGVQNYTWDAPNQERVVTAPAQLQGLTLPHVADNLVTWTFQLRESVQTATSTTPQTYVCPPAIPSPVPDTSSPEPSIAAYPFYDTTFSRSRNCPSSNSYYTPPSSISRPSY